MLQSGVMTPAGFDPSQIFYVDLTPRSPAPESFWMCTLLPGTRGAGTRLVALERKIAAEFGIKFDWLDKRWYGPAYSPLVISVINTVINAGG